MQFAAYLHGNTIADHFEQAREALDQIDIALRALHAARGKISAELLDVEMEIDRQLREHGKLDMAALTEFLATARRR